jgi:hypothetical protein
MSVLVKLLAENPEAKAEHEKALLDAKAEGKASAQEEFKGLTEKVKPILASDAYEQPIKAMGIEVLLGSKSLETFESVVTIKDMEIEKAKEEAAKAEQGKETPATGGAVSPEQAETDYQARKDRLKMGEV